ncbi:glycerate kinase [Lactiplantibacillus fabifermentans T30PCM01]|uniref:Glycerate kinase n=1 Tax=Lactiplantibacillus fabifermentans T30PCM01 TaxID=1400520 RepID=W6T4L6_9LACO|nr:glycerate kinase [Lactiplantibacillus fabifermentans]ETY72683.1 glycerate kinase [Lactiplantibacillus fabifermentans T30PCM01]
MLKVIIMPDSYKGSLSASQVAETIKSAMMQVRPNDSYQTLPVGDGGEGTIENLAAKLELRKRRYSVISSAQKSISVVVYWQQQTAYIQASDVLGLNLVVDDQREPLMYSSAGLGQLVQEVLADGAEKIVIALGGSGTVDGGLGMLSVLGLQLFDSAGAIVSPTPQNFKYVQHVDTGGLKKVIEACQIVGLADVRNPLVGENGASQVFGIQKGLTAAQCIKLDEQLKRIYEMIAPDVLNSKHTGAAGGLGAAIAGPLQGQLITGIDYVLSELTVAEIIGQGDLLIVGEGRLDSQTAEGKVIDGIVSLAKYVNPKLPIIAICGSVSADADISGLTAIFSITPELTSLSQLLANSRDNLFRTAYNIAQLLNV